MKRRALAYAVDAAVAHSGRSMQSLSADQKPALKFMPMVHEDKNCEVSINWPSAIMMRAAAVHIFPDSRHSRHAAHARK